MQISNRCVEKIHQLTAKSTPLDTAEFWNLSPSAQTPSVWEVGLTGIALDGGRRLNCLGVRAKLTTSEAADASEADRFEKAQRTWWEGVDATSPPPPPPKRDAE
jgi:hypothetical protein